ncbi:MAG TPA: hypothetical protein PKY81_04510 [bacterium]|nr:hypothetical protein [bacterium]HPN30198.1 hypothetical protein [bacterium]
MMKNGIVKEMYSNNFKQPRRVLKKNREIEIAIAIDWNSGETETVSLKGTTQGFNIQGCGVIIKLPALLKSVCDDLIPHIVGKEVNVNFDYEDIEKKNNSICGTILRTGKPKTQGYDLFCAIQFDYVPPEISLRISKDLKDEFCDILQPAILKNNSFETRKPDYKYRESVVIRKLLETLKPYVYLREKDLSDILVVAKLKKELSKISKAVKPEEIIKILIKSV